MSLSVAFVTHAGPAIGLGHVRRCLALASAWARDGAEFAFVAPGAEGVIARAAPALRAAGASRVDVSAAAWERVPGAAHACVRAARPDIVVVDSYAASPAFLASLRPVVNRLVAVDDLADRPLPVDVVINGGIAAGSLPYGRSGASEHLLGARYALIDPRFGDVEPTGGIRPSVESVLIALGGAPPPAALEAAIDAVVEALPAAAVEVVAGPFAGSDQVARSGRVTVHGDVPDMRARMIAADLAVTGAGVTLYELAATGTPAVIVEMADNQRPNATGFGSAHAALVAGRAADAGLRGSIADALRRLTADRAGRVAMAARGRALVDGRGALRAAREIAAMVSVAGRTAR